MSKQSANNIMDVNTLAHIIAQSVTSTLAALGVAQVVTHPSSVPINAGIQAPKVNAPSQTSVTRPQAPASAKRTVSANAPSAPASVARGSHVAQDVPNFGDFHCKVGANRTKLPMGLFDVPGDEGQDFEGIILRFADGSTHSLKTDVEGRGRLTVNQTNGIGAYESAGHYFVFTRDNEYANVYDVAIWAAKGSRPAPVSRPTAPFAKVAPVRVTDGKRDAAPVIPVGKRDAAPVRVTDGSELDGAFDAPAPKGAKKPATTAQLAARAAFAAASKAGTLRRKGQAQAQPLNNTITRAESRATLVEPIYATPARKTRRF